MIAILLTVFAVLTASVAQDHQHHPALNARGKQFMGFDQEATAHHFILTKDGGRIEVNAKAADDTKSAGEIRAHLRHIAQAFTSAGIDCAPAATLKRMYHCAPSIISTVAPQPRFPPIARINPNTTG